MSLNPDKAFWIGLIVMPDSSTIDNRCLDSWYISISGQFEHRYPLNISCSKIFDSCKIKRMVTNLTQLGYVNNYDKNRYLENFSKAAVHWNALWYMKKLSLYINIGYFLKHFVYILQLCIGQLNH